MRNFQAISRFDDLDMLVVNVHSVKMPVGFGRAMKSIGLPLSSTAHIKRSVVEFKAPEN